MKTLIFLVCSFVAVWAQKHSYKTTPVPILKQINRHNDDGSYSYGYEGADGTFKIETKFPDGEVKGKYGYVGDDGKMREIEYGASKRGFEPVGSGINVPPPTLTNSRDGNALDYDDGQYREDPAVYYKATYPSRASTRQNAAPSPTYRFNSPAVPSPTFTHNSATPVPPTYYDPPTTHQPTFRNYNPAPSYVHGHPASVNVNLQTGSYSLSYSG